MQKYIIQNKGNIWAYLADIYYKNAESAMIPGKENSFVFDESETETIKSKIFSKGKELAHKIVKNINSNDGKDKAKNLSWLFKPENSFDAKSRPIDNEFNSFLKTFGTNTEENKSKFKWYFLAGFASEYNSLLLSKSEKNKGQKLDTFSERPYDSGIIYDMMQFLGIENDNDFYYLAAICKRLDVNGYANAGVLNSETIIQDIETHIKKAKNKLEFLDAVRILLCLNPIMESNEFDSFILKLFNSDIIKNKSITKEDLQQLVITKAYILNHKCYKNADFQVNAKNIGSKAMEHAENALAFNNIKFGQALSDLIINNLSLKDDENLDLALFATITNSSYFEEKQNELFDKFKPVFFYDPAEILILKELDIDISADRKINLVSQMINFMANKDKENKDGKKFAISAGDMCEILESLDLDKLEKDLKDEGKQGLSEEQKLALIDHVEIDNTLYLDNLAQVLKLDSDKQKMHFLSKLKENDTSISVLADIAKIFSPITSNEMKMKFIKKIKIYTSYPYDYVGNYEDLAKALDLEGEQIDAFLSKFTRFRTSSYGDDYNSSIIRIVEALPKATEKQKMAILDLKDEYGKNELSVYEIVDVIKKLGFTQKEGKKKLLEVLTPYNSSDKSFDEKNILDIAEALGLNPDNENDNDLKNLLLKKLAQQIKMRSGDSFKEAQIDAYEALKISKGLKLNDEQKKYLCNKQDDAGNHTIINFNKSPKKLFSADELIKEFKFYFDKDGKSVAETAKETAKQKINDEIKDLKDEDTCDTDKMAEILNVVDDKNEIPKIVEKLMFKKTGSKKSENLKKIDDLEKFAELANGQKFKEMVKDNKEIKEAVFKAVSKSINSQDNITSALKFINVKEVEENKELKEAIEKNGGPKNIKDIKVPIEIKLYCNSGKQVKKGQKIKITANVKILEGNEEPKGKIKFNLSGIGDSNETEYELKKIGDNIYSAEIECEIKKDGFNTVTAEYIPAEGEYYVNNGCKELEFDTEKMRIDTNISGSLYSYYGNDVRVIAGKERNLVVRTNVYKKSDLPKGKIVVYKCEDKKFDSEEKITEVASIDITEDCLTDGFNQCCFNFVYQDKEIKNYNLRAKFIPDAEENKYVNGENESIEIETLKRDLKLKLTCDDQEIENNSKIKINPGEKKKFKVYLDGYDESLGLKGKLVFRQDDEEIKILDSNALKNVKKDDDGKYFVEVEAEFKKASESKISVKYESDQNDFYCSDSTYFSLEQTFKGKIINFDFDHTEIDIKSENEIRIRVYANVEDKNVKPNGKIEISYEDKKCIEGGSFISEKGFEPDEQTGRYYVDVVLNPKFLPDNVGSDNSSFFLYSNLKYIPGDPDDYPEYNFYEKGPEFWINVKKLLESRNKNNINQVPVNDEEKPKEQEENSFNKKDDSKDNVEDKTNQETSNTDTETEKNKTSDKNNIKDDNTDNDEKQETSNTNTEAEKNKTSDENKSDTEKKNKQKAIDATDVNELKIKDVEVIELEEKNNSKAIEQNKNIKIRVYLDVDNTEVQPDGEMAVAFNNPYLIDKKFTGEIRFDNDKKRYYADIDLDFEIRQQIQESDKSLSLIVSPVISYVPSRYSLYGKACFENKFSVDLSIERIKNEIVVSKVRVLSGVVCVAAAIIITGMSSPISGILCVGLLTGKIVCGSAAGIFGIVGSFSLFSAKKVPLNLIKMNNKPGIISKTKVNKDNTSQKNNKDEHDKN